MSTEAAVPVTATEIVATGAIEAVGSQPVDSTAPEAPPVEVPAVEQPKDDKFAAKFAALSKKEKQLRAQEKAMQTRIKEMEDRFKAQEEALKPYMSLKDAASADPSALLDNLRSMGLDEKKIVEKYILKQEPTPEEKQISMIQDLQKEINALKADRLKEVEQSKEREVATKKQNEVTLRKNYLSHLGSFVEKNANEYELIRANDAVDLIYDVMEEKYNTTLSADGTGVVLTEKEAADLVENYLYEQAKKLIETNKIKSSFATRVVETTKPKTGQTATLSNTAAQQVPARGERKLSDEESKAKMAEMLRFKS